MVHGLFGGQPGNGRHDAGGVCSQKDNSLRVPGASFRDAVFQETDRISAARILRQAVVIEINPPGVRIDIYIFQDGAEVMSRLPDERLELPVQANRLGIAPAFEIEYAIISPTMDICCRSSSNLRAIARLVPITPRSVARDARRTTGQRSV